MRKIKKCQKCSKYTMEKECPRCGGKTKRAGPGPYTFKNKELKSKYRRKLKKNG